MNGLAWTGAIDATIRSRSRDGWIRRIAAITVALLIQAILILGFVAASLGLGFDGPLGVGPDRPPPATTSR
jgi:hypothetical protein